VCVIAVNIFPRPHSLLALSFCFQARSCVRSFSATSYSPSASSPVRQYSFSDFDNTHTHRCMSAGCNWDEGQCNHLFLDAGPEALKPCDCIPNRYYGASIMTFCSSRTNEELPGANCFTSKCDWHPFNGSTGHCEGVREDLKKCPLFDAITLHSIAQTMQTTPLVYLKEGKGFSVPEFWDEENREPFPFQHGHAGRCLSSDDRPVCTTFREEDATTHPPMSGVRNLLDGEAWCDNFGMAKKYVIPDLYQTWSASHVTFL